MTKNAELITRWTRFEDLPEFLSPDEVMAFLGLGRGLVYDLLHTGALPTVRFGRLFRVHREALKAMKDRTNAPAKGV